jgi:carbamoyltransferase
MVARGLGRVRVERGGSVALILGLNAYHGDAAAALLRDGQLVAAVEEERLRRVKHWAGLPVLAARACLDIAGVGPGALDAIAVNRRPGGAPGAKLRFALARPAALARVPGRLANRRAFAAAPGQIAAELGLAPGSVPAVAVAHHDAHLASAVCASGFDTAAAVSVDGFGDFLSTTTAAVQDEEIRTTGRVAFPHSLGVLYQAVTQHLGFPAYGDEYKAMGLAAHGRPTRTAALWPLIRLRPAGRFALDLRYFRHTRPGFDYRWQGGAPAVGTLLHPRAADLLGPPRAPGAEIAPAHADLAASLQAVYEQALWHVLRHAAAAAGGVPDLALAGGCAQNVVANARIAANTPFRRVYVPPAPGDAGGAAGAAMVAHRRLTGTWPRPAAHGVYLGPGIDDDELADLLAARAARLRAAGCRVIWQAPEVRAQTAAEALARGELVGWVQGRMEWGPRALGARSLLADPRCAEVRELLNDRVKRRESFRPFAPAVLREAMADWFEQALDLPWMAQAVTVRPDKRARVPAIVHADGSSRPQTVSPDDAPLFHDLIRRFHALTGVPMLLNTSLNRQAPIVCTPEQALDLFLETGIHRLCLGGATILRDG